MQNRYIYQEEHELFRRSVNAFLTREAVPYHQAWERAGRTPLEIWRKAGGRGLLCPQVEEEFGGPGGDYRFLAIVNEEASRLGVSGLNFAVHSDIVGGYVQKYGTLEQKKKWLPRLVSGDAVGAIAMTEPDTGSDLKAIRTTALRDGDEFVVNGSKTFVSNGQNAGLIIVVAKTDPALGAKGISLLLVEGDREGLRRGRNLRKLGLKAQDTSELFFDDVRVPAGNLLGLEGRGFAQMMSELPGERLAVAVVALGAAQAAYDMTVEYVRGRKAFGQAIIEFQNTRFVLADVKTDLEVGWAFLDSCIAAHLEGELGVERAAMVKLWTTEMQCRVADSCLQLHGGYGYMSEYPISKNFLDARVQRIYGGTSEIMKEIIGRGL